MNAQQTELFHRLMQLQIVPAGHPVSFVRKVASENGWDLSHAMAADVEYRRFLLMILVADHVVCPSEDVDAVWHTHLLYTRAYWDELCDKVAGRPIHHQPSLGGEAEVAKYRTLYSQTLETYQRLFGQVPPTDIWPDVDRRFGDQSKHVRVRFQDYWIIPRPTFPKTWREWVALSRSFVSRTDTSESASSLQTDALKRREQDDVQTGILSCSALFPLLQINPLNLPGQQFLLLFIGIGLACMLLALIFRNVGNPSAKPGEITNQLRSNELGVYDIAYLNDGPRGVVALAICKLLRQGRIKILKQHSKFQSVEDSQQPAESDPITESIYQAAVGSPMRVKDAQREISFELNRIESRLANDQLILTADSLVYNRILISACLLPVISLGIMKCIVGIQRERPVQYLVIASLVLSVVWLRMLIFPGASRKGSELLSRLRMVYRDLSAGTTNVAPQYSALADPTVMVAMFGLTALAQLGFDSSVSGMFGRSTNWATNGGFVNSCGGSGCGGGGGGGGGGCGGCS